MQYLIKNNCIVSVYNAFTIPIMILFLQEIVDIYKQISYKLNQEIDYWNLEIKPMKDLKKASDEFTDDEYEQELRDFLDSNKIF